MGNNIGNYYYLRNSSKRKRQAVRAQKAGKIGRILVDLAYSAFGKDLAQRDAQLIAWAVLKASEAGTVKISRTFLLKILAQKYS